MNLNKNTLNKLLLHLLFLGFISLGVANSNINNYEQTKFDQLQVQDEEVLEAVFTASVTSGEAPLTVSFDASISTGEGELTYEWWFGAKNSTGIRTEKTYKYTGDYVVLLVVSNGTNQAWATKEISVTSDRDKGTLQLPYSIDGGELGNDADNISNGLVTVNIKYLDTIPVHNYEAGIITFLTLYDENDDAIAEDVVVPSIKENIHFDSANTVKADALHLLFQLSVPYSDLIEIYSLIELHPSFNEAVTRVKDLKGLRSVGINYIDPELASLIAQIGFEVGRKYYIDNGTISPNQLTPQETQ